MVVSAHMRVAGSRRNTNFAEHDDTSWATIDAQGASCADVIVNHEDHAVRRISTRHLSALRIDDCRWVHHVNALPRADVNATLAQDAFALINMDELFGLNGLAQVVGIHLDEGVLVGVRHHRWVGVGACHVVTTFSQAVGHRCY